MSAGGALFNPIIKAIMITDRSVPRELLTPELNNDVRHETS